MALSIIEHIYHSYRPHDTLVVSDGKGSGLPSPLASGAQWAPGVLVYHFGAPLYYANASRFTEEIVDALESATTPVRVLVIDAEAMTDIDYSGADSLRQIHEELGRKGATLHIGELADNVRKLLDAYGLTDRIGAGNLHPTTRAAIEAATASVGSGSSAPAPTPGADASGGTAPNQA
jgi:MFS superfamily sulfate permease-like transporter